MIVIKTKNNHDESKEKKKSREARKNKATAAFGSPCWARTSDIMINSHALYRLS